jgi:hypothetical protein
MGFCTKKIVVDKDGRGFARGVNELNHEITSTLKMASSMKKL